jgi:hypothetical protein
MDIERRGPRVYIAGRAKTENENSGGYVLLFMGKDGAKECRQLKGLGSAPSRWVRHPIHSGIRLALIGTAIVRGIVAVVLPCIGFTQLRISEYSDTVLCSGAL